MSTTVPPPLPPSSPARQKSSTSAWRCATSRPDFACIWYANVPHWYANVPFLFLEASMKPADDARHVRVAIAGSGFGGLGLAIRLLQSGVDDFLVFERAGDVGGVWRDNTYPGCACDVQSHLYSFSFAPNPDWSRAYSPAAEIHAYLRGCAERFGVTPHLRLQHEIRDASWDAATQRWILETSRGRFTAD